MAFPELRGTGRLLADPRKGVGKNNKKWASALIKFPTWYKTDSRWEEGEGTVASAIAFEDVAVDLASHTRGDTIGIHGTAKAAVWNDKPQLAATASRCWTPEKGGRS